MFREAVPLFLAAIRGHHPAGVFAEENRTTRYLCTDLVTRARVEFFCSVISSK